MPSPDHTQPAPAAPTSPVAPTGPAAQADPTALLELAVRAAHAAGAELLRRYGRIEGLDTKSSATDPVSDADRASEALLLEMISAERPDDAVIGEEGTDRAGSSGLTWVVDPLDGTVNYLYQLDNFAVSIGVEDAGGGVAGVVYDPCTDRTFTATRGGGAFRDGHRLAVNDPVPMPGALVFTGFGYDPRRRAAQGAFAATLLPRVRDIRRIGSAALDLCAVASGSADAYYEEGINHWDRAAGELVVREAGGLVTPFTPTGQPSGWLAAGRALHADLTRFVTDGHRETGG